MPALTSRKQITLTAGQTLVVDPGIRGVSDFSLIMIVPLAPTAAWSQVTVDTNPSVAGVTMTNTGYSTVVLNCMFMYPHPIMGSQASSTYLGASENVAEPASFVADFPIRQYSSFVNPFLVNLAANPSLRASVWGTTSIQCLTQDFSAPRLAELATAIAAAAALPTPMPIYPGTAVMPLVSLPFSTWCDISYWTTMAAGFSTILAMRPPGESRIGIDAENYGVGGDPNLTSLALHGFTLQQFQTAIQPLVDVIVASGATVCIYPAGPGTDINTINQLVLQLQNAVGPERTEVWWELTFSGAENYRLTPFTQWEGVMTLMRTAEANYNRATGYQNTKHRQVISDDIYRTWGTPMLANINAYGSLRPWVYDITRADRTSMGTANWITGVSLKSANNIKYLYRWPATWKTSQIEQVVSIGTAATPVTATFKRCTATGISDGYAPPFGLEGYVLADPGAPFTYGCVSFLGVLPNVAGTAFMVDATIQIPATLAADAPFLSGSQFNASTWNVYFKFATGEVVLQLRNGALKTELVAMTGVSPGDTVRVMIGRSGNTWLYTGGSQTINRTDPGHGVIVTSIGILFLGGGIDPALFPAQNNQAGMMDAVLIAGATGQLAIYDYLPTDSEITSQMRGNEYPYGRGT